MKILSVSEITLEIKKQLETGFRAVAVKGEISNLKVQSSGHIYFTLKDKEAQISSVLFKGSARSLSRIPKDGDQVVGSGEITVYAPRGNYQLLIKELSYLGVGELLATLHERKNKFAALGYFSRENKKKLPSFPKTVGVVTSPTGAVIQDILHILQRRHAGFHLILSPVKVQGEGAAEEIAKAIRDFNKYNSADVLIVGRGGGSLEDLWAFNEEVVVEAIFASKIPIISAVGHETDFSLSDFVADVRAPTPSAAAELVLSEKKQLLDYLLQSKARISSNAIELLGRLKQKVKSAQKNPYISSPYLLLSKKLQEFDDKKMQLNLFMTAVIKQKKIRLLALEKQKNILEPSRRIRDLREKIGALGKGCNIALAQTLRMKKQLFDSASMKNKLDALVLGSIRKKKENLQKLGAHLSSIDPKNLLTKGYCILFSENKDSVILSSKEVAISQNLKILLKDGTLTTKVEEIIYETI